MRTRLGGRLVHPSPAGATSWPDRWRHRWHRPTGREELIWQQEQPCRLGVPPARLAQHPEEAAAPRQGSPPPPPQPAAPPASSEPPPAPTVVVESYLIAVRDAAAPGEAGLLRPLLRRWHLGTCTEAAFGLPAVQAVVSYKWSRFARRLLLQQLGAYGLWLGSFTAFMLLFNSSDADITDTQLLTTWKGRGAVASEALALVGMLPFAAGEVCVVAAYGLAGWLSAWNLLDCATYGMQLAITVLHLGAFRNGPYWLMLAVAVQAILLVVRLTFFSRVFKSTAFDFVGSLQTVVSEVGWYVAVLLLLMWGFACAFFTIFREDEEAADSFQSLPLSLLTMLNYAVGGTSYYMRDLLASGQPAAALALCTVYQFLVSMLLMSLLTGVMTNALMKTAKEEDLALVLNRAQVIDELETVLPLPVLRLLAPHGSGSGCRRRGSRDGGDGSAARGDGGGGGGADVWMPYIHVLRVNPASLERIDGEEKLWPSAAAAAATDDEDDCEGRGGGAARRIKSTGHVETTAGGGTESGSGDALDEQLTAVQRLETQVQLLEGQLADVRGVVRHMLDLRGDVRQLLALMGEAATQVQQAQQRKEAQQLEAPPPLPPQSLEGQQAQQPAL
ncbi:hypothetical protein PLESTB_000891500 [Pleodorina starrii]|uniref:Ion transport domain-containing protein n=1 Tax=Pleodorina starrii TaxID=330485 RepID=A0A9W6BMU7_9CHLO|nr:hypothetical protein PLESTM_002080600 [Pleodorina starrii]GLC54650.1 hypothetical protein PLESTB_000891500 [Pleodorina starrii]GLC66989.1 hypothetical protein PLESTF_000499300 [Pleodorina starrii]